MTHRWPLLLIAAGFLLLLGGFVYDVLFAGIPYQDPPPALAADYARQARVAAAIRGCGVGVVVVGALSGGIRWAVRRLRSAGPS